MDRHAYRLKIRKDDSNRAAAEFVVVEQPDRDDGDAEPAEHPFPHPFGIVGVIAALHRDDDLPIGTGEMPRVAGRKPGVDDAIMLGEIDGMDGLSPPR